MPSPTTSIPRVPVPLHLLDSPQRRRPAPPPASQSAVATTTTTPPHTASTAAQFQSHARASSVPIVPLLVTRPLPASSNKDLQNQLPASSSSGGHQRSRSWLSTFLSPSLSTTSSTTKPTRSNTLRKKFQKVAVATSCIVVPPETPTRELISPEPLDDATPPTELREAPKRPAHPTVLPDKDFIAYRQPSSVPHHHHHLSMPLSSASTRIERLRDGSWDWDGGERPWEDLSFTSSTNTEQSSRRSLDGGGGGGARGPFPLKTTNQSGLGAIWEEFLIEKEREFDEGMEGKDDHGSVVEHEWEEGEGEGEGEVISFGALQGVPTFGSECREGFPVLVDSEVGSEATFEREGEEEEEATDDRRFSVAYQHGFPVASTSFNPAGLAPHLLISPSRQGPEEEEEEDQANDTTLGADHSILSLSAFPSPPLAAASPALPTTNTNSNNLFFDPHYQPTAPLFSSQPMSGPTPHFLSPSIRSSSERSRSPSLAERRSKQVPALKIITPTIASSASPGGSRPSPTSSGSVYSVYSDDDEEGEDNERDEPFELEGRSYFSPMSATFSPSSETPSPISPADKDSTAPLHPLLQGLAITHGGLSLANSPSLPPPIPPTSSPELTRHLPQQITFLSPFAPTSSTSSSTNEQSRKVSDPISSASFTPSSHHTFSFSPYQDSIDSFETDPSSHGGEGGGDESMERHRKWIDGELNGTPEPEEREEGSYDYDEYDGEEEEEEEGEDTVKLSSYIQREMVRREEERQRRWALERKSLYFEPGPDECEYVYGVAL